MVTDITAFISSTERQITHNKSKGLHTVFLMSIKFANKSMVQIVKNHFSEYNIDMRMCPRIEWDITISW